MVINRFTTIAVRCLDCGPFTVEKINIFFLSGTDEYQVRCSCGHKKARISRSEGRKIEIYYYCPVCNREHRQLIPGTRFWSNADEYPLVCRVTGLNLGYYGQHQLIKKRELEEKKEMESLVSEFGSDDFSNPEVILEVLDYLHDLAAQGALRCECGSVDINISLCNDKLKLLCGDCTNFIIVPASSREELNDLKTLPELELKREIYLLQEAIGKLWDSGINQ